MGAILNKCVSADGVIAYQDHEHTKTFHCLPTRIDAIGHETLLNFEVKYYGINKKPYMIDMGSGHSENAVGGTLSGRANPSYTEEQKSNIINAIEQAYGISEPNLVPLEIYDVNVQPVFAKNIVEKGTGSNTNFPKALKFGSTFNYSISSGNSLFAEMAGSKRIESEEKESSDFGINITGFSDFYGDPWKAKISADLSKVWEFVRTEVDANLQLGWLDLGTKITDISQKMLDKSIVKIEYIEGSGGDEFGRQLLESTKTLFEAINNQVTLGEGFFKFAPNPEPLPPNPKDDSWGASLLPWTASVNIGYENQMFQQEIKFEQEVSFTGKLAIATATSMNLALQCGRNTKEFFFDLQEKEAGCISKQKTDALQKRLLNEAKAKNTELKDLMRDYRSGKITFETYTNLKAILNEICLTDDDGKVINSATDKFKGLKESSQKKSTDAVLALKQGKRITEEIWRKFLKEMDKDSQKIAEGIIEELKNDKVNAQLIQEDKKFVILIGKEDYSEEIMEDLQIDESLSISNPFLSKLVLKNINGRFIPQTIDSLNRFFSSRSVFGLSFTIFSYRLSNSISEYLSEVIKKD